MSEPRSRLDRTLNLFTEVRSGEGAQALLLALNIFLILTAYYVLKPVREGLILSEGSAELKSYLSAGQAVVLLPVLYGYGKLADKYPRRRLINVVTAIFMACLGGFTLLGLTGARLAIPFFVWIGIFNVMIIAQFWAFANDVYTNDEGERLFPLIGFGMSAGAVAGTTLVGQLVEPFGLFLPMLLAAALLGLGLVITNSVDSHQRQRTERNLPPSETTAELPAATGQFRAQTGEFKAITLEQAQASGSGSGSFALVFRTRYLLLIALMIMLANLVNSTGEYILGSTFDAAAESAVAAGGSGGLTEGEYTARLYSGFFAWVNGGGLLLQLFLVSRVIKYLGVRVGLMILPLIALGGYGLIAAVPLLGVVRWSKTAENATDYSLQNTVKAALWLPTTREQKYKAKQVIDAFFVRTGDVLSAGLVWLGTTYLALSISGFATVTVIIALMWLAVALAIGTMYRQLTQSGQPPS